jgi:hypothetical protein
MNLSTTAIATSLRKVGTFTQRMFMWTSTGFLHFHGHLVPTLWFIFWVMMESYLKI